MNVVAHLGKYLVVSLTCYPSHNISEERKLGIRHPKNKECRSASESVFVACSGLLDDKTLGSLVVKKFCLLGLISPGPGMPASSETL